MHESGLLSLKSSRKDAILDLKPNNVFFLPANNERHWLTLFGIINSDGKEKNDKTLELSSIECGMMKKNESKNLDYMIKCTLLRVYLISLLGADGQNFSGSLERD